MATAADLGCNLGILEQCDYHARKWTTYCTNENMVCCDECLNEHRNCLSASHSTITDKPSGRYTDRKSLISKIQKCISEQENVVTGLLADEKNIDKSINHIELHQQNINNMFDQLKKELAHEAAAVKRKQERLSVLMSWTKSISEEILKNDGLRPALLFVAYKKIKNYKRIIKKAFPNTPSYGSQFEKGIGERLGSMCQLLKSLFDYCKQRKGSATTSLIGDQYGRHALEEYPEKQSQLQIQAENEKQRQAEASKEMLYRVYGNVVVALEEYERRSDGKRLSKFKIDIPDQSWKTSEDVKANVESQLVVFQAHNNACPSAVSDSVNVELRIKTIYWSAVREEKRMKQSETDKYLARLYEILVKGKTHHTMLDQPRQKVTEATIKQTLSHIFRGKHEAMEIDNSFENNPTQKASGPKIRTTRNPSNIDMGAKRIQNENQSLHSFLQKDVQAVKLEIGDLK